MKKDISIAAYLQKKFELVLKQITSSSDKVCDVIDEHSDSMVTKERLLDMYENTLINKEC